MRVLAILTFILGMASCKACYLRKYNKSDEIKSDLIYGAYPKNWNWGDMEGVNYLTKNLNQHIPQYCECCFYPGMNICYVLFIISSLHKCNS